MFDKYVKAVLAAAVARMKAEIITHFTREEAIAVLSRDIHDKARYLQIGNVDRLIELKALAMVLADVKSDLCWAKMQEAKA